MSRRVFDTEVMVNVSQVRDKIAEPEWKRYAIDLADIVDLVEEEGYTHVGLKDGRCVRVNETFIRLRKAWVAYIEGVDRADYLKN